MSSNNVNCLGYYTDNYKEDDKPAPPSFGAALLSKAALATAASSQIPATSSFTSQQQGSAVYTNQNQTTAVYSTQQQTTAVYTTQQQEVKASFSNLLPTNFPTFEQKASGSFYGRWMVVKGTVDLNSRDSIYVVACPIHNGTLKAFFLSLQK